MKIPQILTLIHDEYKEKVYFYNFSPCIFIIS